MRKLLISLFAGALFCSPALADWTGKDASSATITFKNPVACASVVCVPVVQLYDGTNVVTLTTAGADGASNTLTGVPTYARMQKYNGTTWDRWTGAVTVASGGIASGAIASGAFASGSIGSGAVASGAFASGSIGSGAVASGAVASGAYASGSIASGAMVDLGSQADAACGTDNGACSAIALIKRGNQTATTTATAVQAAIPAGTNLIGKVGIDQTTPGTTNGVQVNAALPAGTNTVGNVGADPSSGKGTPSSVAINVSTATTTQIVAISGSTKIYVTSFDVIAGGTGNITFEYGTGASCGTGTTVLTGAYNLTAQAGISKGNGVGAVLVVPSGNALCVLTTAAVQMSGSVSYQQF